MRPDKTTVSVEKRKGGWPKGKKRGPKKVGEHSWSVKVTSPQTATEASVNLKEAMTCISDQRTMWELRAEVAMLRGIVMEGLAR